MKCAHQLLPLKAKPLGPLDLSLNSQTLNWHLTQIIDLIMGRSEKFQAYILLISWHLCCIIVFCGEHLQGGLVTLGAGFGKHKSLSRLQRIKWIDQWCFTAGGPLFTISLDKPVHRLWIWIELKFRSYSGPTWWALFQPKAFRKLPIWDIKCLNINFFVLGTHSTCKLIQWQWTPTRAGLGIPKASPGPPNTQNLHFDYVCKKALANLANMWHLDCLPCPPVQTQEPIANLQCHLHPSRLDAASHSYQYNTSFSHYQSIRVRLTNDWHSGSWFIIMV